MSLETLPSDGLSLLALTFLLGMKHGFDADHLSAIDGLTRYHARIRPTMARFCGTLFSLGHGAVVMAIALGVSALAGHWEVPALFATLGAVISIVFLLALGSLNLATVLLAKPHEIVQPAGLWGRLLGGMHRVSHPALVGVLFAFSFDTLSQASFFALTATQFGGWQHALLLAGLFTAGMLLTDGINGLWFARLIARTDQLALIASRVMGLVVAAISLLVAALGAAKLLSPSVDAWSDGKELLFGGILMAVVALSFWVAVRLTRQPAVS